MLWHSFALDKSLVQVLILSFPICSWLDICIALSLFGSAADPSAFAHGIALARESHTGSVHPVGAPSKPPGLEDEQKPSPAWLFPMLESLPPRPSSAPAQAPARDCPRRWAR